MIKTMHSKFYLILLVLLIGGGLASPVSAATYKYRDEAGNIVYSQNPPEDKSRPYEVLGNIKSHAPRTSSSAPAPTQGSTILDASKAKAEESKVAEQVARAKELRKQNCAAAKKNLEIYTVYRRVQNDQGEMVRLNDDERAQKIDDAKKAMKEFCD